MEEMKAVQAERVLAAQQMEGLNTLRVKLQGENEQLHTSLAAAVEEKQKLQASVKSMEKREQTMEFPEDKKHPVRLEENVLLFE